MDARNSNENDRLTDREHLSAFTRALKISELETLSRHLAYGCVTMESNGSHADMTAETFLTSIEAITSAMQSIKWHDVDTFEDLRVKGFFVEQKMFRHTKGVNTHKGLVFLVSFLAEAWMKRVPFSDLQMFLLERARPLTKDYEKTTFVNAQTLREAGIQDIRQIPLLGFEPVLSDALWMQSGHAIDELSLRLIAKYDDTTTIRRSSIERLRFLQARAAEALASPLEARVRMAKELNEIYLDENISSGGVADLVTTIRLIQRLYLDVRP